VSRRVDRASGRLRVREVGSPRSRSSDCLAGVHGVHDRIPFRLGAASDRLITARTCQASNVASRERRSIGPAMHSLSPDTVPRCSAWRPTTSRRIRRGGIVTYAGHGYATGREGWPFETSGGTVLVSKLRGSEMHRLCIDLYQRHRPSGSGLCLCCGAPVPCRPRCNAAKVIQAAGEEPARYDAQTGGANNAHPEGPDDPSASVVGWSLGRGVQTVDTYER
jgi:hypothetical protein